MNFLDTKSRARVFCAGVSYLRREQNWAGPRSGRGHIDTERCSSTTSLTCGRRVTETACQGHARSLAKLTSFFAREFATETWKRIFVTALWYYWFLCIDKMITMIYVRPVSTFLFCSKCEISTTIMVFETYTSAIFF